MYSSRAPITLALATAVGVDTALSMKLVYCGSPDCPPSTFKRLLILADHINFVEPGRPVLFAEQPSSDSDGVWRLVFEHVGTDSMIRGLVPRSNRRQGVTVTVRKIQEMAELVSPDGTVTTAAPKDINRHIYHPVAARDLVHWPFRELLFEGLQNRDSFVCALLQRHFTNFDAVRRALLADRRNIAPSVHKCVERFMYRFRANAAAFKAETGEEIRDKAYEQELLLEVKHNPERVLAVLEGKVLDDPAARRDVMRWIILVVSMSITSALIIAQGEDCIPVTDDRLWAEMLRFRLPSEQWGTRLGDAVSPSVYLGLEIIKAGIPDEALQKLDVEAILAYRRSAADVYKAWSEEVDRLAVALDSLTPGDDVATQVRRVIADSVKPRLREYRNEMRSVAEKLFGDVVKKVLTWQVPALSLACLIHLTPGQCLAMTTGAVVGSLGPLVDYVQQRRTIRRKNSMAYLVGLQRRAR